MSEFMNVQDVRNELGVSRSSAYKVIRNLNQELQNEGYLVVSGKVPRRYFVTRYYLTTDKKD